MIHVEEVFERIACPRPDAGGLQIALLLEELCHCSLRDDDDGVAKCSALIERHLTTGAISH